MCNNYLETRTGIIDFCKTFQGVYEDYPFHDDTAVMRCSGNKKIFLLILKKGDTLWLNVKVSPDWIDFWRSAYTSVVPGFHMNKSHWNSIILDGTIPEKDVKRMIAESYDLIKPKVKKRKVSSGKGL